MVVVRGRSLSEPASGTSPQHDEPPHGQGEQGLTWGGTRFMRRKFKEERDRAARDAQRATHARSPAAAEVEKGSPAAAAPKPTPPPVRAADTGASAATSLAGRAVRARADAAATDRRKTRATESGVREAQARTAAHAASAAHAAPKARRVASARASAVGALSMPQRLRDHLRDGDDDLVHVGVAHGTAARAGTRGQRQPRGIVAIATQRAPVVQVDLASSGDGRASARARLRSDDTGDQQPPPPPPHPHPRPRAPPPPPPVLQPASPSSSSAGASFSEALPAACVSPTLESAPQSAGHARRLMRLPRARAPTPDVLPSPPASAGARLLSTASSRPPSTPASAPSTPPAQPTPTRDQSATATDSDARPPVARVSLARREQLGSAPPAPAGASAVDNFEATRRARRTRRARSASPSGPRAGDASRSESSSGDAAHPANRTRASNVPTRPRGFAQAPPDLGLLAFLSALETRLRVTVSSTRGELDAHGRGHAPPPAQAQPRPTPLGDAQLRAAEQELQRDEDAADSTLEAYLSSVCSLSPALQRYLHRLRVGDAPREARASPPSAASARRAEESALLASAPPSAEIERAERLVHYLCSAPGRSALGIA